jgi:hypothetical protein
MGIIGVDGRAAILREIAKGLQMPVDDVVPSREKFAYNQQQTALAASAAASMQQTQQPAPVATGPSGEPKGGMAGNTVSSRVSGAAA